MLEVFLTKRKSKIHGDFFLYVARKVASFKGLLIDKCSEIEKNNILRPAQLKQIAKLKNKISKKSAVKEETEN
jgi:hypothetical protein